jgi:LacI family transcriptional regulator
LANREEARISQATRLKVLQAARALGYTPNLAARALVKGRSQTVAVLTFDHQSAFASEITSLLESLAHRDGYRLITTIVHRDLGGISAHVDGVLALDYSPLFPPPLGVGAYVSLGVYVAPGHDSVVLDYSSPAREALHRLAAAGCSRLAYMTGQDLLHDSDPRLAAYLEVMALLGREPEVLEVARNDRESAYRGLQGRIQRGDLDGVFCRNDLMAIGCLRAVREAGLKTPDDFSILGCDGSEEGQYAQPSLSTLSSPLPAAVRDAWELLMLRLNDPTREPVTHRHPAAFVPRGTTPPNT